MKLILSLSIAWVACLLVLVASGDFDIRLVPEPGHGEAWFKQRASPTARIAWTTLYGSGLVIASVLLFYGCRTSLRRLQKCTRFQRGIVITLLFVTSGCGAAAVIRSRYIQPTAEHRLIAEACLGLARFAPTMTNHIIQPDDPKIPQALRAVNPIQIVATPENVVVFVSGSLREYHLSQCRADTNTWILYAAVARSGRHKEILRIHGK